MAAILRRVVDAQLDYPAVERADPLQLGGRQAHLGEACVQGLDHVLSRHRSRRCVRVLRSGEEGFVFQRQKQSKQEKKEEEKKKKKKSKKHDREGRWEA